MAAWLDRYASNLLARCITSPRVVTDAKTSMLMMARALYRKPRLLVLDEATSHLDAARERQVNAAVQQLELIRIVIAHRPETAASAHRSLVVLDGSVQTNSPYPLKMDMVD